VTTTLGGRTATTKLARRRTGRPAGNERSGRPARTDRAGVTRRRAAGPAIVTGWLGFVSDATELWFLRDSQICRRSDARGRSLADGRVHCCADLHLSRPRRDCSCVARGRVSARDSPFSNVNLGPAGRSNVTSNHCSTDKQAAVSHQYHRHHHHHHHRHQQQQLVYFRQLEAT